MKSFLARRSRKAVFALLGASLLQAACSGGEEKPILVPSINASLQYTPQPLDGTAYFANTVVVGGVIQMDVVIQDNGGTLDIDDVDLVLQYDSTFIQVVSINGQNTVFGTCNTVNPACNLISPVCIDNQSQANGGGGKRLCRIDGTTPCAQDSDCTTPGDVCGSFGTLEAAFAVITGPKTCSNNPATVCSTSSDCQVCKINTTISCTSDTDCSGTCGPGNVCSNNPGRSCTTFADCVDQCDLGTCGGCPSVIVSGVRRIASLTLRVMRVGTGDIRFVDSTSSDSPRSAARKDLVDQGVTFFPKVGGSISDIRITGRL